jgi:hypothetical protein
MNSGSFFLLSIRSLIKFNKIDVLQKIYGDILGNRQLAGDLVGNAPSGLHFYFGIFPRVSTTL